MQSPQEALPLSNPSPAPCGIKGILSAGDVAQARDAVCDAVILSNHGGRQLDYAISGVRAIAAAKAKAGDMPMVDGGFRRGTDVLKAFALGADFVFVGRPMLCAAFVGRLDAVAAAVEIMKSEVHRDLGLMGLREICEISEGHLQGYARSPRGTDWD